MGGIKIESLWEKEENILMGGEVRGKVGAKQCEVAAMEETRSASDSCIARACSPSGCALAAVREG